MAAASLSPVAQETLVIGLLFALVVARRAYAQYLGTTLSAGRLLGYAVVYPLLFVFVVGTESYPVVPLWSIGVDVAAGVVGAVLAFVYVGRRVTVYQEGGAWMYRLGPVVPVIYIGLFLGRLGLELAIGLNPYGPSPTALSAGTVLVLEVVDALYGFSTGLALGRNVGVYRAWQRAAAAPPPPSPPASPPLRSEHS